MTTYENGTTFLSEIGVVRELWVRLSDWKTSTITFDKWCEQIDILSDDLDPDDFISRTNAITVIHEVLRQSFKVYGNAGNGHRESVYHDLLKKECDKNVFYSENEYKIKNKYKQSSYNVFNNNKITLCGGGDLEPDLVIMHSLDYPIFIIELKARSKLIPTHTTQTSKYSKHRRRPSMLINFNISKIEIHIKVYNVEFDAVLDVKYNATKLEKLADNYHQFKHWQRCLKINDWQSRKMCHHQNT